MSRPKKADQIDAAEKLLASAKKLFLMKGYERVTIREIADDAKAPKASSHRMDNDINIDAKNPTDWNATYARIWRT